MRYLRSVLIWISFAVYANSLSAAVWGASQAGGRDPNLSGAVLIIVSPDGFHQPTIELPVGSHAFVILNRTGFDEVTVLLERMSGRSPGDPPAQQEFGERVGMSRARVVKSANLSPGTYRLRVANRPAWLCAIHVN